MLPVIHGFLEKRRQVVFHFVEPGTSSWTLGRMSRTKMVEGTRNLIIGLFRSTPVHSEGINTTCARAWALVFKFAAHNG